MNLASCLRRYARQDHAFHSTYAEEGFSLKQAQVEHERNCPINSDLSQVEVWTIGPAGTSESQPTREAESQKPLFSDAPVAPPCHHEPVGLGKGNGGKRNPVWNEDCSEDLDEVDR